MLLRKQIPNDPRYTRTKQIAVDFMIKENINGLPVDPRTIALSHGWKIEKAGDIAKDLKCSLPYLLEKHVKSEDGAVFYCEETKEYKIVYNERVRSQGRIRWTLMHEIGHIVLGHLIEFSESKINRGLNETEYEVLEKEANYFTGQVLAPPAILHKLNVRSITKLKNICKLSDEASEHRFGYLLNWTQRGKILSQEHILLSQFYDFIYKKYCDACGNGLISKLAKNCPICGQKLKWGGGILRYNDGYKLDESGHAIICPRCGNEEVIEGNYCKICGAFLINLCLNENDDYSCGGIVEGNARFCIYCGSRTTFYRDALLLPWEIAKQLIEEKNLDDEAAVGKDMLDREYVPNDDDIDDLPF